MKQIDEDKWEISKSGESEEFLAEGIYQCLVVILFDVKGEIGAIYHAPESGLFRAKKVNNHRVENAIFKLNTILNGFKEMGADYKNLKAVISGGLEKGIDVTVSKTLEDIKKLFMENGIEIVYEDTGGSAIRRDITFKLPEGKIKILKRAEKRRLKREILISIPQEKVQTR